jgi:hypothetical protein
MDYEQSASMGSFDENAVEESEVVDGVLVVADVRAVDAVREGPPPFVQVAAVAATGFFAGAATAAVLGRHFARVQARRGASATPGSLPRQHEPLEVVATRSFVVHVHALARR